jgi:hypothetical protein
MQASAFNKRTKTLRTEQGLVIVRLSEACFEIEYLGKRRIILDEPTISVSMLRYDGSNMTPDAFFKLFDCLSFKYVDDYAHSVHDL